MSTPPPADAHASRPESSRSLTRAQRLDRLPFTRRHLQVLTGSGAGWALDAMDVGLISYIVAALAVEWQLTSTQSSWIVSAGFIGMALGASLGGLISDRVGRRTVFTLTLLVYGVATGMAAFSTSVAMLIVIRFFIGLGLGAELPVASTLVSEFAPPSIRGRVVVILEAFWAVGWTLAAIIGFLVVPHEEWGWRVAFLIGALPALYAVVVRVRLPESVRFLEGKGRTEEAETVVRNFESSAPLFAGGRPSAEGRETAARVEAPPITPTAPTRAPEERRASVGALFRPGLKRTTISLWIVWFAVNFSYYGAFIWIPSILAADGYSLVTSFGYTLIITVAQLPGYAAAAWLIEVWGRRSTLIVFLLGSALSAVFFGTAGSTGAIIGWGMALSFFNLGAWGALYAVSPEIYPTWLRGTGSGWAAGFGRLASIIAPLIVPTMLAWGGRDSLFLLFGMFFLVACAGALFLPNRAGQTLEE